MTTQNTTGEFINNLRRLLPEKDTRAKNLTRLQNRNNTPVRRGESRLNPLAAESAGIASPVSETTANDRTYHPVAELTSTDGLIVLEVEPIASIDFEDDLDNSVVFNFDDPNNPT